MAADVDSGFSGNDGSAASLGELDGAEIAGSAAPVLVARECRRLPRDT
jgi:hypothetical protein